MENQKLEDCYYAHSSTIFSEMLGEDENYQRLKNAKIAAEKALQPITKKYPNDLDAADVRHFLFLGR